MQFNFNRNIQSQKSQKEILTEIKNCIDGYGPLSSEIIENKLSIETKHIFAYWSGEYFSLIDSCSFEIMPFPESNKFKINYQATSLRVWLFALVFSLILYLSFNLNLLTTAISLALFFAINYIVSFSFLRKLLKKIVN